MRIRLRFVVRTVALSLLYVVAAPASHADGEQTAPRYFALIDTLSKASTSADSPASPCLDGWRNRQAGPEFFEAGCPKFEMPADYPDDLKSVQLNLMARLGKVFAIAISHDAKSWEEAAAIAARLRRDLPASFACQGDPGLLRCTSGGRFVVIGSVEDVPGESPEASMLFVRDLATFQAFFANDFPARASK